MVEVGSLEIVGTLDIDQILTKLDKLEAEVEDSKSKTVGLRNEFIRLSSIASQLGALFAGLGIGAILASLVKDTLFSNTALRELLDTIGSLVDTFADMFKPEIDAINERLEKLQKKLKEDPDFAAKVEKWTNVILGFLAALVGIGIITKFIGWIKKLGSAGLKAFRFFKKGWSKITKLIRESKFGKFVKTKMKSILKSIKESKFGELFKTKMKSISTTIKESKFGEAFISKWHSLVEAIKSTKIGSKVGKMFSKFKGIKKIIVPLEEAGSAVSKFGKIFGVVAKAVGRIFIALDVLLSAIDIVKDIWDAIHGDTSAMWQLIVEIVLIAIGLILVALGGWVAVIGALIASFATMLVNIIANNWDTILGVINSAWEAIKNAVKSGIDFITGLWDGLVSKAQAVWDKVRAIFSHPIKSVIDMVTGGGGGGKKKKGGFLSNLIPSAQSGGFVTGTGLVNVHAGEVIAPTDKIVEAIRKAGTGNGGGSINITVNTGDLRAEADINTLVEVLRKRMAAEMAKSRRGGAPNAFGV